jgi:hypothetical protein
MSLSLEVKKSKAVYRLISDIAVENNIKQTVFGEVDEYFNQEDFNNIFWFSSDVKVFNSETEKLPSPITWKEFKLRLDDVLSKVEYGYNRKSEYPPVEEQLDMIFKDIDAWRDQIQAIKDKYPKPE